MFLIYGRNRTLFIVQGNRIVSFTFFTDKYRLQEITAARLHIPYIILNHP